MAPITIVTLLERENTLIEGPTLYVFEGALDDQLAIERVCDELTAQELDAFNAQPPVARHESGPDAHDLPITWLPEFLRESYVVYVHITEAK